MKEPVVSLCTGISYEKSSIGTWQNEKGDVCPITGRRLGLLVDNEALKAAIQDWKQQIKGFRRIQRGSPTTYCLGSAKKPPLSTVAIPYEQSCHNQAIVSAEIEHKKVKSTDEMFHMVGRILQTFTDAGLSDYVSRVIENEKEDFKCSHSSMPYMTALIDDAVSAGYMYNLEYKSIFHQCPTKNVPKSDS
jgi:hypothetical protein